MKVLAASCLSLSLAVTAATAADFRVVSWNIGAVPTEELLNRAADFQRLDTALSPDVLVLVEVTNRNDVATIAKALGWKTYFAAVTDGLEQDDEIHMALELGLLSKVPISSVIEYDARRDRKIEVFSSSMPDGDTTIAVKEQRLAGVEKMEVQPTDRGTMRVDLANGLTIFPVHLKSNSNNVCFAASEARDLFKTMGLAASPDFDAIEASGNEKKAKEDMDNAKKRERVIAATKLVADEAVAEGRDVLIAGDYNTSFETGKVGSTLQDCVVQPFGCARLPFPAAMCTGDGYDDSFAILSGPLVGSTSWQVLTSSLGRTFDDLAFADKAIDHFAVPTSQVTRFTAVDKALATFGSDHFPIFLTYSAN